TRVPVNDLARLLGAGKFWRGDLRRLLLRAGDHRLALTADNPFVLVDDRLVRLEHDVVSRGGELQVPVELVRLLPEGWARLSYDAEAGEVRLTPAAGAIASPRVTVAGGTTLLAIPTDHPEDVSVTSRARERFRIRMAGEWTGVLPHALPDDGLLR